VGASSQAPQRMFVQTRACLLVGALAGDETRHEHLSGLRSNGTLGLAISALKMFHRAAEVQQSCLSAVDKLLALEQEADASGDAPVTLIGDGEDEHDRGIASLANSVTWAMRRFPNETLLQQAGCSVTWRLIDREPRVQRRLRDNGALALVLSAMARLPEEKQIQTSCPAALAELLSGGPGPRGWGGKDRDEMARAPELLMLAMRAFSDETATQSNACSALAKLLKSESRMVAKAGLWERVVGAIFRMGHERVVQSSGCQVVTVPAGVGEAVAAALAAFPGDERVKKNCLEAQEAIDLCAVTLVKPCWDAVLASRAADTALDHALALTVVTEQGTKPECADVLPALSLEAPRAMRRWPDEMWVQATACLLVTSLVTNQMLVSLTTNQSRYSGVMGLLSNGTLRLAVSALEGFEDEEKVQSSCLTGIDKLLVLQAKSSGGAPESPSGDGKEDTDSVIASLVTPVATVMRRFPNATQVQERGCSVIEQLTTSYPAVRQGLIDEGALGLLLSAMALLPEAKDAQAHSSAALAQLLLEGPGPAGWGISDRKEMARAPELILRAMRTIPDQGAIPANGCLALAKLLESSLVEPVWVGHAGAWGTVASAMTRLPNHRNVQSNCCNALAAMAKRGSQAVPAAVGEAVAAALVAFTDDALVKQRCLAAQEAIATRGIVQPERKSVITPLNPCWEAITVSRAVHTPKAQEAALNALREQVLKGEGVMPECTDVLPVLSLEGPAVMRRWPGDWLVQANACILVYTLAWEKARHKDVSGLLSNGTLRLVASALEGFQDNVAVQDPCLTAVDKLLYLHFEGPTSGDAPGTRVGDGKEDDDQGMASLVTPLTRALSRFPDRKHVQEAGCSVLRQLTSPVVLHRFIEEGAFKLVADAMAQLPESVKVQAYCPAALVSFMKAGPGPKGWRGNDHHEMARAPELILRAMRTIPDEGAVPANGCFALAKLFESSLVKIGKKAELDVWETVTSAMSRLGRHRNVQCNCCFTVAAMLLRRSRAVPAGVGEAVAEALAAFPDDALVKRNCLVAQEGVAASGVGP
jgi:hypothetical protein